MKKTIPILLGLLFLASVSCEKTNNPQEDLPEIVKNTTGHEQWETPVDYSKVTNWLNIPAITKDVDVVYFYPTCYTPSSSSEPNLCSIDLVGMRSEAADKFAEQATAFQEDCNIFAPYYKQVSGSYGLTLSDEDNETLMRFSASKDPTQALDYYFNNFNDGRPFILAGHSQGSEVSLFLLADYFKNHPEYYKKMVAAYIIGYSVTSDFLSKNTHLKFATGASDTGVIISWNTEGPGNSDQHNAVLLPNAVSINPLNWKLDATRSEVSENLGSIDDDGNLGVGIADAQIDLERGSVICASVDPEKYSFPMTDIFGPQCYHEWDYGLYYANIRANAKQRIAAFQN